MQHRRTGGEYVDLHAEDLNTASIKQTPSPPSFFFSLAPLSIRRTVIFSLSTVKGGAEWGKTRLPRSIYASRIDFFYTIGSFRCIFTSSLRPQVRPNSSWGTHLGADSFLTRKTRGRSGADPPPPGMGGTRTARKFLGNPCTWLGGWVGPPGF